MLYHSLYFLTTLQLPYSILYHSHPKLAAKPPLQAGLGRIHGLVFEEVKRAGLKPVSARQQGEQDAKGLQ